MHMPGRRLGSRGNPRPGPVASLWVEADAEGGLFVVVGVGVGALGTVAAPSGKNFRPSWVSNL